MTKPRIRKSDGLPVGTPKGYQYWVCSAGCGHREIAARRPNGPCPKCKTRDHHVPEDA